MASQGFRALIPINDKSAVPAGERHGPRPAKVPFTGRPSSKRPPRLARLIYGVLSPTDQEQACIEAFDRVYETMARRTYGRFAPAWAWLHVGKALMLRIIEIALCIIDHIYRK